MENAFSQEDAFFVTVSRSRYNVLKTVIDEFDR